MPPVTRLRGEPALYECPACHEHHGSVLRLEGLPVLPCPTAPPGVLHLMLGPPSRANMAVCFIVGPQPEPVETPAEQGAASERPHSGEPGSIPAAGLTPEAPERLKRRSA
jgi:hypothetical protein